MKQSQLRNIIKEEISSILSEGVRLPEDPNDDAAIRQIEHQLNNWIKRYIRNGDMTNDQASRLVEMLSAYRSAIENVAGDIAPAAKEEKPKEAPEAPVAKQQAPVRKQVAPQVENTNTGGHISDPNKEIIIVDWNKFQSLKPVGEFLKRYKSGNLNVAQYTPNLLAFLKKHNIKYIVKDDDGNRLKEDIGKHNFGVAAQHVPADVKALIIKTLKKYKKKIQANPMYSWLSDDKYYDDRVIEYIMDYDGEKFEVEDKPTPQEIVEDFIDYLEA